MNLLTLTATQLRHAADLKDQLAKLELEFRMIMEPGSIPNGSAVTHRQGQIFAITESIREARKRKWSRSLKRAWKLRKAKKRTGAHKWTAAQRAKFKATMQARGHHHATQS